MSAKSSKAPKRPRSVHDGPRGGQFVLVLDKKTGQYRKMYKRAQRVAPIVNVASSPIVANPPPLEVLSEP